MPSSPRSVCQASRCTLCDREEGEPDYVRSGGDLSNYCVLIRPLQPCTGGTVVPRLQERAPFGTGTSKRGSKVRPSMQWAL